MLLLGPAQTSQLPKLPNAPCCDACLHQPHISAHLHNFTGMLASNEDTVIWQNLLSEMLCWQWWYFCPFIPSQFSS